jgi:hypothetical protein
MVVVSARLQPGKAYFEYVKRLHWARVFDVST